MTAVPFRWDIGRTAVAALLRKDTDNWCGFSLMLGAVVIGITTDSTWLRCVGVVLLAIGVSVSVRSYRDTFRLPGRPRE